MYFFFWVEIESSLFQLINFKMDLGILMVMGVLKVGFWALVLWEEN